jgi:uncharacterized protein (DUF1778 family)
MENSSHVAGKTRKNREERFELRLIGEEKEAFRQAADLAGMPLASWVRERLRRAAREELEGFGRPVPFLDETRNKG